MKLLASIVVDVVDTVTVETEGGADGEYVLMLYHRHFTQKVGCHASKRSVAIL